MSTVPARDADFCWTCDVCGKKAEWDDDWSWYGAYNLKRSTGAEEIIQHVTCSDACRDTIEDPATFNPHELPTAVVVR